MKDILKQSTSEALQAALVAAAAECKANKQRVQAYTILQHIEALQSTLKRIGVIAKPVQKVQVIETPIPEVPEAPAEDKKEVKRSAVAYQEEVLSKDNSKRRKPRTPNQRKTK
jgi:hypothetical protein